MRTTHLAPLSKTFFIVGIVSTILKDKIFLKHETFCYIIHVPLAVLYFAVFKRYIEINAENQEPRHAAINLNCYLFTYIPNKDSFPIYIQFINR